MTGCILITGGTGKFGRVLTGSFLEAGRNVVVTTRSAESFEGLAALYPEAVKQDRLLAVVSDMTSPDAPAVLADQLAQRGLLPQVLVNNARSLQFLAIGADGRTSRDNFTAELLLDVVVPYELTNALLDTGAPLTSVINIGSIYGVVAATPALYDDHPRQSALHYGVAKAALVHLTKELAVRLAPRGVRVNMVSYGGVTGRVSDEFVARYSKLNPLGRMLNEGDIAGPVVFLASDAAAGMTGHNMMVDGGWTIW